VLSQEARIKELDLRFLKERLTDLKEWSEQDAQETVRRYKNFLILLTRHPEKVLAPAADIDEAWHEHILHTVEYTRDCLNIFGEYLHHTPARKSRPEEKALMEKARSLTSILYQKEFGEPYILELDISSFW
jgi:hypothetical protein